MLPKSWGYLGEWANTLRSRTSWHSCSVILIEGNYYTWEMEHSEHKAGYDKKKYKWKISECPVCNVRHYFDKQDTGIVEFVPYGKEND